MNSNDVCPIVGKLCFGIEQYPSLLLSHVEVSGAPQRGALSGEGCDGE